MTDTEKWLMFCVGVRVKVKRTYLPGGSITGTIAEVMAPFESADMYIWVWADSELGLLFMQESGKPITFCLDGGIEVIND